MQYGVGREQLGELVLVGSATLKGVQGTAPANPVQEHAHVLCHLLTGSTLSFLQAAFDQLVGMPSAATSPHYVTPDITMAASSSRFGALRELLVCTICSCVFQTLRAQYSGQVLS